MAIHDAGTPDGTTSPQPVDILRAYKLRVQHGLSYREISDITGQPKSSIHRALTDLMTLLGDPERLAAYPDARAPLLNAVEERLTWSLMDPDVLEKASLRDRAVSLGIITDKRRLEAGQSTSNLAVLGKLIVQAEERLGASTPPVVGPVSRSGHAGQQERGASHVVERATHSRSTNEASEPAGPLSQAGFGPVRGKIRRQKLK